MTFSAVSCCICSPRVSCASATSVFSLTASGPPPCHSACNHCGWRQNANSSEILPPPSSATLGTARYVVRRWRSSKALGFSNSTSFSTAGRMKPISPTRILCALRPAPHLSVLLLTNPSSIRFHCAPDNVIVPRQHLFPHPAPCALHYGIVRAEFNTAPSHH